MSLFGNEKEPVLTATFGLTSGEYIVLTDIHNMIPSIGGVKWKEIKAKLNLKKREFLGYLYNGGNPNIGPIRGQHHTKPFTLIEKTPRNLRSRLKPMVIGLLILTQNGGF